MMACMVPRLLLASIVSFLLLIAASAAAAWHDDSGQSVKSIRRERKLQVDIEEKDLFTNLGNVLRAGAGAQTSLYTINDLALSSDEQTLYYAQCVWSNGTEEHTVEKVNLSAESLGSNTSSNVFKVAGPWPKEGQAGGESSSVFGLLMLNDRNSIVIADKDNSVLRILDLSTGTIRNWINVTDPVRLAKHPSLPYLFLSTIDKVYRINITSPSDMELLAGGSTNATNSDERRDEIGVSVPGSELQFNWPMIGARSISQNGSFLYVAHSYLNRVRRMETATGYSSIIEKGVTAPKSLALTSDGCNLFIGEWASNSLLRFQFQQPDGILGETTKILTIPKPRAFSSLILSNDDRFLYVGVRNSSGGGEIYKLELNDSIFHNCRPGPSDSTSPGILAGILGVGILRVILGVGILGAVLVLAIVGYIIIVFRRPASGDTSDNKGNDWSTTIISSTDSEEPANVPKREDKKLSVHRVRKFSLLKLQEATNNFDDAHLLTGKGGGYGDVYRASLNINNTMTDVAIKAMRGEFDQRKYSQFEAEVNTLSQVAHKNLCELLGFCLENKRCILVYPFVKGGSLHHRLHNLKGGELDQDPQGVSAAAAAGGGGGGGANKDDETEPLSWMERMSIAEQVAAGLRYLHHEVKTPILHRDIKGHNILIEGKGENVHVYLIDFGLAKTESVSSPANVSCSFNAGATADVPPTGTDDHSMPPVGRNVVKTVFTQSRSGTPGYMAPEYAYEMKLTTMNDVYAFGVVLLELVTGRKALLPIVEDETRSLVFWTRRWLSCNEELTHEQLMEIVDPRLKSTLTPRECDMACKLAMLGHICTQDSPEKRPLMTEVMERILNIKHGSRPLRRIVSHIIDPLRAPSVTGKKETPPYRRQCTT